MEYMPDRGEDAFSFPPSNFRFPCFALILHVFSHDVPVAIVWKYASIHLATHCARFSSLSLNECVNPFRCQTAGSFDRPRAVLGCGDGIDKLLSGERAADCQG
jgi:hypothetical protein